MIDEYFIKAVLDQYFTVDCVSQEDILGWGKTIRKRLKLKEKSYFLKEKVPYLTIKEFRAKVAIHNLLRLQAAPVSMLVTTRDKKKYATFGNRYFELHEWVPGRFINHNCTHEIGILGEHTGILTEKLHILYQKQVDIRKLLFPKARYRWFPDTISSIERYFNNLFSLYPTDAASLAMLSILYKISNKIMYSIDWKILPESIIHGDLSSDNAMFNAQLNNITFIDFDDVRVSKRIWDIARLAAIMGSLQDNELDQKELNTEFAYEKVSMLLKGYQRNFRFNQIEKNNITHVIILNLILAFLSEFDIDDLESPIFSQETISITFEKLLMLVSSLLKHGKIFI